MSAPPVMLPINRTVVSEVCRWCQAQIGEVHSPACPCGERYRFIQSISGLNGRPFVDEEFERKVEVLNGEA